MADQVVLLNQGRIEQNAAPRTLYAMPATTFAARFIGTPAMNLVALDDGPAGAVIRGSPEPVVRGPGKGLTLGIRPEHIRLVEADGVAAEVTSTEYHGADTILTARVGQESLLLRAPGQLRLETGAAVRLGWDPDSVHLFDAAGGARVDAGQALRRAA